MSAVHARLEAITRKWWFLFGFLILQFLPPYTSRGYAWTEIGRVYGVILSQAFVKSWEQWYPVFKAIPVCLIVLLAVLKGRVGRLFALYAAASYAMFAVLQNVAVTQEYGVGIVTVNVLMFLVVAAAWVWEVAVRETDFDLARVPLRTFWVGPLALLALWYPLDPRTGAPDFSFMNLFSSPAGLSFCMMTPVWLSVLLTCYPRVNLVTLRITSLVGAIIGLYNMWVNFLLSSGVLWWNGILHVPLLVLSLYGLFLSFPKLQGTRRGKRC